MAKIVSISTVPAPYKHEQMDILRFMQEAYGIDEEKKRVLRYLYKHSGIDTRYSTIPDYTLPMEEWEFFPKSPDLEPFPSLEKRMQWFQKHALEMSFQSATKCIDGVLNKEDITHLITISCTGMSAPGLELQLMEKMELAPATSHTAINFMGCYAAIHGLKQASDIIQSQPGANVLIVCTELCTLHFQKTFDEESISAPLLFSDGSAAVLVTGDNSPHKGLRLDSFYSEVLKEAKDAMSWNLSSNGFIMTLSAEVPELFKHDIVPLKQRAIAKAGYEPDSIKHYCIHPGGKRILEAICAGLQLEKEDVCYSYEILKRYGNMSSPTILFVLKEMWKKLMSDEGSHIFGAAFGPGLTMESMIMTVA